jgi:hypothetical protein
LRGGFRSRLVAERAMGRRDAQVQQAARRMVAQGVSGTNERVPRPIGQEGVVGVAKDLGEG